MMENAQMMEKLEKSPFKSLKIEAWADSRTISSGSDRSARASSQGSSAKSLLEKHSIVTPDDYIENVPPKVSAATSELLMDGLQQTTFQFRPMQDSEGSATEVSSSPLSAESDISEDDAQSIDESVSNTEFDSNEKPHYEKLPDSPFPVLIEARDHPLHSPAPQRRYRPKVTASYEPPPLPMYAPEYENTTMRTNLTDFTPNSHHQWAHFSSHAHSRPSTSSAVSEYDENQQMEPDGFEYLADSYVQDGTNPAPLYRRFQILNHRVLLHLQDEISRMEKALFDKDQEIRNLSRSMKHARSASHRKERSESNRSDSFAQIGGIPSTYIPTGSPMSCLSGQLDMRTQLLGSIFIKLGQYNQALASYSAAAGRYSRADRDEVNAFKEWASKNDSIQKPEQMDFLDKEEDLMSLDRPLGKQQSSQSISDQMSSRSMFASITKTKEVSEKLSHDNLHEISAQNSSQIKRVTFDIIIACTMTILVMPWIAKGWEPVGMIFASLLVLNTVLRETLLSYY